MTLVVEQASRHSGDLELDCDDVVVGSGAGGAVVAAMLAESGRRVIVLEEGPYLPVETIQELRPSQHLARAWRDGGMTVAVGIDDSPTINVTMGRAVGGSSIVTGAVCFRTPEHVLRDWSGRLGLSELAVGLTSHFEQVERAISVNEVPAHMRSLGSQRFAEGAEKLGYEMEPLRRNTKGCNGCGRCNFGCPHSAKMSVDLTYLPRAVAAGASIWSDCLVDAIAMKGGRATGVQGRVVGRRPGLLHRANRVRVHAGRVVVAAGAYHTPLLLKRSGVGKRSGQVGRNLTLHPSFRMFARFDERIDGWRGALQSVYSKSRMHAGLTLVGLFVPPGVLAATMPGFGPAHVRRAADIPHLAVFGGLLHDEAGGTVWRGPGREPIVTYRMAKADRARIPDLIRRMGAIFFAAGAKEVFPPIIGQRGVTADQFAQLDFDSVPSSRLECSSQHPLGSARLGMSENDSVTDVNGRVWGTENLFVADGSLVPTSLGVNPQVTVMALAARVAEQMTKFAA